MSKADLIRQSIIGRIFEDPQTVTASWALRIAFPPVSSSHATREPTPAEQPRQRLFNLLNWRRSTSELERLSRSFERLAQEHQSLKMELARLMALTHTRPTAAPERNPWQQWIAAHRQELEKHRGMVLAIDHEQRIVASGADHEDLSFNLQKYLEGQRLREESQARLLITHASFYIDDV